jgi:transposase-like protein
MPPTVESIDLPTIAACFSDEADAYKTLEGIRWPDGPICPHCGVIDEATYLEPKNGGRKTNQGKVSPRRVWKCRACKKQFSVTVGTIFERSHIKIHKWLMAVYLMSASKNGVSAHELHRTLKVTYKTAWFMCHRIREAMKREPLAAKFTGTVVADETWIGGKPSNRHRKQRYEDGYNEAHKSVVFSLVHQETGEVRSQVIPNVQAKTLRSAIEAHVDLPETHLHTDNHHPYIPTGWHAASHGRVNHSMHEYVRDGISTNPAEGYFSQLKRSLDGTYHHVSQEHLGRYLAEFDYRYSTRKMGDGQRTVKTIQQATGRRLTYRDPIG